MIELSPDQEIVLDAIFDWWLNDHSHPFLLGGLAGTGKSTIIAEFARQLPDVGIAFACYTGKASHVLRTKLAEAEIPGDVGTIHSWIYDTKAYEIRDPVHKFLIRTVLRTERRETLPPEIELIIVDEASMVSEQIWHDLCSYGVPILAVGDHFQLPPISSDHFNLMAEDHLDVRLEKIHRQAERSPIIQVARWARERQFIPFGEWAPNVRKITRQQADGIHVDPETMVLTGRNRTRVSFNKSIRAMHHYDPFLPVVGDRVVCRRNNFPQGVANGMTGTIAEIERVTGPTIRFDVLMDHGSMYRGRALLRFFNSERYHKQDGDPNDPGDVWDYAYALTTHCAQGSQAHSVIVIEDLLPGTKEDQARWLYTAVTRATNDLLVIG